MISWLMAEVPPEPASGLAGVGEFLTEIMGAITDFLGVMLDPPLVWVFALVIVSFAVGIVRRFVS